jgi:hypothetical protein
MARTDLMKKTVEALLTARDEAILHFTHSTQRDFIYNNDADYAKSKEDPELSCAGDVVKTIIDDGYIAPLVFFHRAGMQEDEYNVHDGKQRLMSVLQFIDGEVVTKLADGSEVTWGYLLEYYPDLAAKILNFEFDIQIRYGDETKEERSFFKSNTTGIPLTEYEGLKGAYHGKFFDTFEAYLERKQLQLPDCIKPIGRGEQAIWYLYLALDILDDDKTYTSPDPRVCQLLEKAKSKLALCRDAAFNPTLNKFEDKLNLYCRLVQEGKIHKGDAAKQAAKAYRLANYIITNSYDQDKIVEYFRTYNNDSHPNDIGKWKFNKEIRHAITMLLSGRTPDPLRYFTNWPTFKDTKIKLWTELGTAKTCPGYTQQDGTIHACGSTFKSIDDAEMDHINPYDLGMEFGGVTTADNCQLVCKSCNTAKSNK